MSIDFKNNKNTRRWMFKNKHRASIARDVAFNYLKNNSELLYNDGIHKLTDKGLARAIQRAPQKMIYALNLAAAKRTKELGAFIRTTGEGSIKLVVQDGHINVLKQGPQGDRLVKPADSKYGYTQQQITSDKSLVKTLRTMHRFLESGGKPEKILTATQANNIATNLKDILHDIERILEKMDEDEFFYIDSSSEDVSYIKPDMVAGLLEALIDKVKEAGDKTPSPKGKELFRRIANDLQSFRIDFSATVNSGEDLGGGKIKHDTVEIEPQITRLQNDLDGIADSVSDAFSEYVDISNKILVDDDE